MRIKIEAIAAFGFRKLSLGGTSRALDAQASVNRTIGIIGCQVQGVTDQSHSGVLAWSVER
jgi:hypothetical protein